MSITRRITANYSRRRKAARIRNESANSNERVETARYDLPIERAVEPVSDLVAESPAVKINRSAASPRRANTEPSARFDEARAQAERILKEHVEYDEYGSARCVLCGFSYPCDAVCAAEILMTVCARVDSTTRRPSAAPRESYLTPN